jgi:hypothetical protein
MFVGETILAHLPDTSDFKSSEIRKSGISFRAGIGKSPINHLIVASLIDTDIVSAQAPYFVSISRTIAVIFINHFLVAPQHFSLPDFVISPELFPAGGAAQH